MKELTIKDLLEKLQAVKSKSDALHILKLTTWANISYVTGYLGNEERNRILAFFK